MTVVRIPPTLREETGGQAALQARGETVRELLDDLTGRFPALRERIYSNGDLARFVNVYVEGEDVRTREGLDTSVDGDSTVILLPAMAGGLKRRLRRRFRWRALLAIRLKRPVDAIGGLRNAR